MLSFYSRLLVGLLAVCLFCLVTSDEPKPAETEEEVNIEEEKLEYAKGSLCGYCDYCKVGV